MSNQAAQNDRAVSSVDSDFAFETIRHLFKAMLVTVGPFLTGMLLLFSGNAIAVDESKFLPPPSAGGPYQISNTGPAGGIVFYITNGGLNGLEAAPVDQSNGVIWGCYGVDIAGAYGTEVGTGNANTVAIVKGCSEPNFAAKAAADYIYNGYSDWFLPSKDELDLLYQQRYVVGGFTSNSYWSSTENDVYGAWNKNFNNGAPYGYLKNPMLPVRAVRAF
jgi:hypothetical protein